MLNPKKKLTKIQKENEKEKEKQKDKVKVKKNFKQIPYDSNSIEDIKIITPKNDSIYDPYIRDPKFSKAQFSALWELNILKKHCHPTVK